MKRKILSAVALLIAILCIPAAVAFAHSGGTDENGGHWDHSTGTYHYHHGYPAHQHPNGVCPYDFDDAAEESSSSSLTSRVYSTSTSSRNATAEQTGSAYQRGYDIGYSEGNAAGHTAGYTEGRSDGIQEGYDRGKGHSEDQTVYLYIALTAATVILFILIFVARKAQKLENENFALNRYISSNGYELNSQADRLEALTSAHEKLQKTYNNLYHDYQAAKSNLVKSDALTVDYEVKLENLIKDNDVLKSQIAQAQADYTQLSNEKSSLQIQLDARERQLLRAYDEKDLLSQDCAQLYSQNMELIKRVVDSRAEEELADYDYSAFWLTNKSRPAPQEAKRIKELRQETKRWIERALRAEAELETLRGLRTVHRLTGEDNPQK